MVDFVTREPDARGSRPEKKWWGKYIGYVRDTNDPEQRGRIRCFCPEVMGELDDEEHWIPWALPCFPMQGGFDAGSMMVPPDPRGFTRKGKDADSPLRQAAVWLEFRHGEVAYPIYVGGFIPGPDDLPNFAPPATRVTDGGGGDETTRPPTGTMTATFEGVGVATEPDPPTEGQYPFNRLYKSPSGHLVELDDTPQAERIRVYHRSGTYYEMNAAGTLVTKVVGKRSTYISEQDLLVIINDRQVLVQGNLREQINGETSRLMQLQTSETYGRDHTETHLGAHRDLVSGLYALDAAQIDIGSTGALNLSAGGDVAIGGINVGLVGLQASLTGATGAGIQCPTGVTLSGSGGPPSAAGAIIDGTGLAVAFTPLAVALAAAQATFNSAIPPNPITNAVAITALFTAIQGILAALPSNLTIHRVSRA